MGLLIVYVIAALATGATPAEVNSIVNTTYGQVSGISMTVFNGAFAKALNVWHAIPYAKPPIGELRFSDPQPPEPWDGVFDATDLGNVCPQDITPMTEKDEFPDLPNVAYQSEDCLVLHIYAPYDTSRGPYPVMVWYHGGGFLTGSANQYPGYFLATHDIIVVTVNYRLNKFGFSYTSDGVIPGNAGMRDQQEALRWVQQEIAAFGGDPTQVTIAGQSAGGISTSLHLVAPDSHGLFHQAIAQSGNEMGAGFKHPKSDFTVSTKAMATDLGCPTDNTTAMVSCLRLKSWRTIKNFHCYSRNTTDPCTGFSVAIGDPGGFLPDWPRILRERGEVARVPLLSGICRDDASFITLREHGLNTTGMDRSNFTERLRTAASFLAPFQPQELQDVLYRQIDGVHAPWPHIHDLTANMLAYNQLLTDVLFGVGWDLQVKMQQEVAPVYTYVFNYRHESATIPEWMGVTHTEELKYEWGYTLLQLNENVINDSHISASTEYSIDDIKMTIYFQQMITNFIKYGNPTPQPVERPFDDDVLTWPPYSYEAMNYHWVSAAPEVRQEYRQKEYSLFEYLMPAATGVYVDGSSVVIPA